MTFLGKLWYIQWNQNLKYLKNLSFQFHAERYLNQKVLSITTDNGIKFCNKIFEDYLEENGICAEHTKPHTPEQNSIAKGLMTEQ